MVTFLLVHGAWHGGWSWNKVTPRLRAAGHNVFTPTLTGLGERAHQLSPAIDLETHLQDVLGVLEYEDLSNVVLVGHSYGGILITAVAERAVDRLAHLVYLDAFVPEDGQSLAALMEPKAMAALQQQTEAEGDGWRAPPFPLGHWGITAEEDLNWMQPRMCEHPIRTFLEPVQLPRNAAATLPRTYISCTVNQRPHYAATAKRVRDTPGWRYRELATGHDAMVTEPQALTDLLLEVV